MNHLSAQDMFECRIGSHERGSHLVNQACVGPGKVFVDTVENFQLAEDFLNAVEVAQGIRKVKTGMGEDAGVVEVFADIHANDEVISHGCVPASDELEVGLFKLHRWGWSDILGTGIHITVRPHTTWAGSGSY